MSEAGDQQPGGMAAIFGLDEPQVQGICDDSADRDYVGIGCPSFCGDQSVISGTLKPLLRAVRRRAPAHCIARIVPHFCGDVRRSFSQLDATKPVTRMDRLLDEVEVQVAMSALGRKRDRGSPTLRPPALPGATRAAAAGRSPQDQTH